MNVPICVRDGCETGIIKIGEFEFEIDLTELSVFLNYAGLEMRCSCQPHRGMLLESLACMERAAFVVMTNSIRPTESDNAKNLQRWQETGCGGHTQLDEAWKIIKREVV